MDDRKNSIQDDEEKQVVGDEEQAFITQEKQPPPTESPKPQGLSKRFWISACVNTIATAGIVFVNKRIFEHESLRHAQVTFAAMHFTITAGTLYVLSSPSINVFPRKKVSIVEVLPLATAMIFNVVLPNASLAFSSIQFYQIVRILLTPCVALLNYIILRDTVPMAAILTLIPVCAGVGIVTYFETKPVPGSAVKATGPLGVIFAFSGLASSALYTVWIKRYGKLLTLSDHQLLLNQAPVSVLIMLYIIPFSDDVTVWKTVTLASWVLILLSGALATLINVSQFAIISEAGPVSSTVVGQFKACSIFVLGWVYSKKPLKDGSLLGVILAMGGIISYSMIMHKTPK